AGPCKATDNRMSLASLVGIAMVVVLSHWPLALPVGETQAARSDDILSLPLRDQHGKSMTIRSFEGRALLLNFIFTHCVSACHTQVKSLDALRTALPANTRARVRFLSISLDPSQDTPEMLRKYAQAMGVDDAEWSFATGSPSDIAEITRGLGVKRESLADGQIDHTLVVILFDAKGRLMQRYSGAQVNTARLVREIDEVVRSSDAASESIPSRGRER
ncbi:MAG TPA: SCO family protein, partial [Nitrospiraceae bacterium]|nr:SCO family protein [Nitrospiraceae bacterium]